MAKTNFEHGTIVQEEFLDLVFSHVHDGQDLDGHASKINLTDSAHITGTLPKARLEALTTADVSDVSQFNGSSLTATLNTIYSHYQADTLQFLSGNMELSGYSVNKNLPYFAVKITRKVSNATILFIDLHIDETYETSTTIYLNVAGASIPAGLRPESNKSLPIMVFDNGSLEPFVGSIRLTPTGDWAIRQYNGDNFTAAGAKGVGGQLLRYIQSITLS